MTQEATGQERPDNILANIQRLTRIVLDKLEQGSSEGTLDQAQIGLLGSIAMRSLGLWQETLNHLDADVCTPYRANVSWSS